MKEGLCVQMMHIGPFDDEPTTVAIMDEFLRGNGYDNDFTDERLHHEIYLSDANYNSCRTFESNRGRKVDLVHKKLPLDFCPQAVKSFYF